MNTIRGIIADFRALWQKLNGEKWVLCRCPATGRTWFPSYSSSGLVKAEVVRYWYREPLDPELAIGGDFEAACIRGTAKKRVATLGDITSGLVSCEDDAEGTHEAL